MLLSGNKLPHLPEISMRVSTNQERINSLASMEDEDQQPKQNRKNSSFTQVYPQGWKVLRQLMDDCPIGAKVYSYLAENCDKRGALIIPQEVLASEINVTSRSIRTATKYLHEKGIVIRLKVGGNTYLYSLNPREIWKSWDNKKDYAVFNTIAHIDKNDEHNKQAIQTIKALYQL